MKIFSRLKKEDKKKLDSLSSSALKNFSNSLITSLSISCVATLYILSSKGSPTLFIDNSKNLYNSL